MPTGIGIGLSPALVQLGTQLNQNAFVKALAAKLQTGISPATILVQGDSTGVTAGRWVYKIAEWLAAKYPTYTSNYCAWNDTNQNYDLPIRLVTGSNGEAYCNFPGVYGNFFHTSTVPNITTDIEIIAKIACDDYSYSAIDQTIVSKFGGGGDRGFAFGISANSLYWWWSNDGVANTYKKSDAVLPVINGADLWVKVTHDIDNGSSGNTIKFYTSTDGSTWVQLGTDVVTAGVTTIFASAFDLQIGCRTNGTDAFGGKIYKCIVKNGIDGKVIAAPDFARAFPDNTTSFQDICGNTFTVAGTLDFGNGSPELLFLNGSVSGANMAYSSDATRFAKQTPIIPDLSFINYSHNEGANVNYTAQYESFCSQILTKFSLTGVVCTSQNPQIAPEVNIAAQATRCAQIKALAIANHYGLVNVYDAFVATGNVPALMQDGAHPNADGYVLWVDKVKQFMNGI